MRHSCRTLNTRGTKKTIEFLPFFGADIDSAIKVRDNEAFSGTD